MTRPAFVAAMVLTWGLVPMDPARGAPSRTHAPSTAPAVEDGAQRPLHPAGVEDAWLRVLGEGEGDPQPVTFEHDGQRIHAFDLPSEWSDPPEVRVEDVGAVRVVWAYLAQETRLGVALHDRSTGKALGHPLLVEGETFIEELGCGGLLHINDLIVILDAGYQVTIGMRFGQPFPDGSEFASVLVFPRPGVRGRLVHLSGPMGPGSRVHVTDPRGLAAERRGSPH